MRACGVLGSLVVVSFALAGCAGGDPAAEPGGGGSAPPPAPTAAVSPEVQCLIDGSPWSVSTTDLASQIAGVLRGLDVTDSRMDGSQTLTVTPDLVATFTDDTVTTITVELGDGLTMVGTQTHTGTASGRWRVEGSKLIPDGPWEGGITGTTEITVNGVSGSAPIQLPDNTLGAIPLTFSCDGALNLTAEGSPYVYLFQ